MRITHALITLVLFACLATVAAPASADVVTTAADSFATTQVGEVLPTTGWRYMWNPTGVILNQPTLFEDLLYVQIGNGRYYPEDYDTIPNRGNLLITVNAVGDIQVNMGLGQNDTGNTDNYNHGAVLAYTVQADDPQNVAYSLENISVLPRPWEANDGSVEVYSMIVYSDNTVSSLITIGTGVTLNDPLDGSPVSLGTLAAGDTIFFMVGPEGTLTDDLSVVNFDITAVPEPASMTLLGVGALAVLRRKK